MLRKEREEGRGLIEVCVCSRAKGGTNSYAFLLMT